jgi:CheY-like chemotaxis protein
VVIYMDIKMPKMNGIEVLKKIKVDPKLKNIPVVMITSSRLTADIETCYQLGANAYVVKPVKFEDFIHAVKNTGIFWAMINEPLVK